MEKMKKILYFIVTLLEIGLFAGTFIVNYYTVKKLGMLRWVNFTSMKWEKNYPIVQIKIIAIILLVIFSILTLYLYLKRKSVLNKMIGIMVAVTCIISIISIGYILLSSFESMKAYYLICMMLVAAAILQFVKTLIGIMICHNG